jgi:hypothetical protein
VLFSKAETMNKHYGLQLIKINNHLREVDKVLTKIVAKDSLTLTKGDHKELKSAEKELNDARNSIAAIALALEIELT